MAAAIDDFGLNEPGIFEDFDIAQYHADPCPVPSLNQSLAKLIIERSPLHAWANHPRLNSLYVEDEDTKFDLGNAAHGLLLGRSRPIVPLDFNDWRSKEAKTQRDFARSHGNLPVLREQFERATEMRDMALTYLDKISHDHRSVAEWLQPQYGSAETVIAWTEGKYWFRSLLDWLTFDRRLIIDYKTTERSAAPQSVPPLLTSGGWDVQAAFHERGLDFLDPVNAGKRTHLFIVQEAEPPYALTVLKMTEAALTMGRKKIHEAIGTWVECLATDEWPGYPKEVIDARLTEWSERQWLNHEIELEEKKQLPPGSNILAAG